MPCTNGLAELQPTRLLLHLPLLRQTESVCLRDVYFGGTEASLVCPGSPVTATIDLPAAGVAAKTRINQEPMPLLTVLEHANFN